MNSLNLDNFNIFVLFYDEPFLASLIFFTLYFIVWAGLSIWDKELDRK